MSVDCGDSLLVIMSLILPSCVIFALYLNWIIRGTPHQSTSVIEYRYGQHFHLLLSDGNED